jgi:aminocarboxymuconate-semialdehyde decarboxylase
MMTRRRFWTEAAGATAGMLLVGRVTGRAATARMQAGRAVRRREVVVGGRRVKTIDVHAHCEIAGIREMMGGTATTNRSLIIGPDRLREMDAQGIDVEVLSINSFWNGVDRDLAGRLIAAQNKELARQCGAYPDRLVGLASVALQHPDLAAAQLEEAVTQLGLRGAAVGASANGEDLSSSRFDPFWAKAEELGAPIFLHPQGVTDVLFSAAGRQELQSRLQGNGVLGNVIGNPLGTTIALSRLIFEGTLDRFPRLKICAAHGGGYLPSYADRSDHGCLTFPEQCTKILKKRPTEYLRQLYFDSLVFTGEALRHLVAVCGVSQIVLGTDHPFPWTSTAVDHVLGTAGLSNADRAAILGGNAAKLLNIPL